MPFTPQDIQEEAKLNGDTVVNPTGSSNAPVSAANDFASTISSFKGSTPTSVDTGGNIMDAIKKTGSDEFNGGKNFLDEANRGNNTPDASTNDNAIIRTGENALGATASAVNTLFSPISNAIKAISDNFAENAKDPMNQNQPLTSNPVVGKILDFFGGAGNKLNHWATAHPEAARNLSNLMTVGTAAVGGEEGTVDKPIAELPSVSEVKGAASDAASKVKQAVKPSLTPEEATGQIVQGKTEDIQAAHNTLKSLDTKNVETYKDLQNKINSEISPLSRNVDAELSKDTTRRPIDSFDQTIGKGDNATKMNYVQEAINNLKELYTKTKDAQGLSDIKDLEDKAKGKALTPEEINNLKASNLTDPQYQAPSHGEPEGLTNKEVNDLSRTYNSEFGKKAFSKTTGDPLTSVNAQAYENIRKGLKSTARNGLGGDEAKALDAKLSDLYDTKMLIDKMVEKVNSANQKTTKQGIIPKTVGKIVKGVDTVTGGPIKAIGKVMGTTGNSGELSPIDLESNLVRNLKSIK